MTTTKVVSTTKLKTTNKHTGEVYYNNVDMPRESLEQWIQHVHDTLGNGYLVYEIVEEN